MQDQCGGSFQKLYALSGTIENIHLPGGNGVRIDTAVFNGYQIPPNYDSMIMKVIVYDKDRPSAIAKMEEYSGRGGH